MSSLRTKILLTLGATLVLVTGCVEEESPDSSQTRSNPLSHAESSDQIKMISDTHYIKLLPEGVETPKQVKEGAILWEYQGQVEFVLEPKAHTRREVVDEPEKPLSADYWIEDILGSERIDELGRLWIAVEVDRDAAKEMFTAYDQAVEETVGLEDASLLDPNLPEYVEENESMFTKSMQEMLTWFLSDCDGNGGLDRFRWDSDDRVESANLMNVRQRKVMRIQIGNNGLCSGTMVDDEWLLTAAHCVTDDFGNNLNLSDFVVCTYGNYQSSAQCFSVVERVVASGWSSGQKMEDDYAVLKLSASPGVGWMAISSASNGTLESNPVNNVGFPGTNKGPVCSSTFESSVNSFFLVGGTFRSLTASTQYRSQGELFNATTNLVKTRVDLAKGHSGGPFFYYPSGCCGSHFLTGVVSAYKNPTVGNAYTGGPKGPKIRNWVTLNTP